MSRRFSPELPANYTDLCLDTLDVLNPVLDYEYSLHSLYSKSSSAYGVIDRKQAKLRPGWRPANAAKPEDGYRSGTWSFMPIKKEDWKQVQCHDILDLHRLTEKFYDMNAERKAWPVMISEFQKRLYAENLAMAAFNDRLLKEAYVKLADQTTTITERRKIRVLIKRLKMLPHLYKPSLREGTTKAHVTRWLLTHTDKPEPEMVGFTSPDPFEPRRLIATVEPRRSTSDSNVVLGKRKRTEMEKDEWDVGATGCGSDTLLTENGDCVRPLRAKRMRASKQRTSN